MSAFTTYALGFSMAILLSAGCTPAMRQLALVRPGSGLRVLSVDGDVSYSSRRDEFYIYPGEHKVETCFQDGSTVCVRPQLMQLTAVAGRIYRIRVEANYAAYVDPNEVYPEPGKVIVGKWHPVLEDVTESEK
jgi:hypothetical protein